jgi:hypothetical protein
MCYKYAGQQMIKQGRGGRIIGASSVVGKQGKYYCTQKEYSIICAFSGTLIGSL